MPFNFNIDIHCHPSGKPYMSGRSQQRRNIFESYDNPIRGGLLKVLKKFIERSSEVLLATQSNFDNLHKGNVRVCIISLTPMEKAFLVANQQPENFWNDIKKDLAIEKKDPWQDTIKNKLVNALTGFELDDIDFVMKSMRNYFQEGLVAEYEYVKKFDDKENETKDYRIKLVKNFKAIEEALASGENTICVILSIEGAHTLSSEVPNMAFLRERQGTSHRKDQPNFLPLKQFDDNIRLMKQWDFVPLFISLNHHFWNGLGGHAKSLMNLIGTLVSQSEGLNEGLKEIGKDVIKFLLDKTNGPRVLIDIKHMSPECRRDFYNYIKQNYWSKNDKFPLICSHTGVVSKSRTLAALMKQNDDDELFDASNYLHENSINICEEDILIIAETKGLIGIQLDEKRIAGKEIIHIIKNNKQLNNSHLRRQYVKVLFANIFEVVRTVGSKEGWNLLSIGSDYDGLVNHLDFYPTAGEMPVLRNDMLAFLKAPEEISQDDFNYKVLLPDIKNLMFDFTPEEIIDKIFAGNTMDFLKNNFNR